MPDTRRSPDRFSIELPFRPVEDREPVWASLNACEVLSQRPTIAVFDNFGGVREGNEHGRGVINVVMAHGRAPLEDIQRVAPRLPRILEGGPSVLRDGISRYVAGFLDDTSAALEQLLEAPESSIQVISQSMGVSKSKVFQALMDEAVAERENPSEAELEALSARVMDEVNRAFEESPEIAQAQRRYADLSERLEARGILHVVSAGNDGELISRVQARGVEVPGDFTQNVLADERKIVVAASTGAVEGGADRIAPFSSPSPLTRVAADGTRVPVGPGETMDGTSFSAPQVTALIDDLWRLNPDLTTDGIRNILEQACRDTPASAELEGAGILDPDLARRIAANEPALSRRLPIRG